jgi:cytochrome P450
VTDDSEVLATTSLPAEPRFPLKGDVYIEPDPLYARLRAQCPVYKVTGKDGRPGWLVTRYNDAKRALVEPRFTRAGTIDEQTVQAMGVAGPAGRTALIYADPPLLSQSRKLIAHYFNGERVEALRPRAGQIVDELLDQMLAAGAPADLLADLARPLPMGIICELLGIPLGESDSLRQSVELLMATDGESQEAIRDAFVHVYGYLSRHVAERHGSPPTGDLISDLVHSDQAEPPLTEAELVGFAMLLFVTGHETTMTQIVNSCLILLQEDTQLKRLRSDPGLLESCVEELLRFVPLGHAGLPFAACEDMEFGGVRMAKGDLVFVSKLSANRDERAFPAAGSFDITRTPNKHMAFSHGPHYCLGAALARMEMQVAIGRLVTRIPTLRLAVDTEELQWRTDSIQRGPTSLPVAW